MELFSLPPTLPSIAPPAEAPHIYTISEVTRMVRTVIEGSIGQIWVEGEVSNYRKQASGHQYWTLKDDGCQLSCVLFARGGAARRAVPLADGMHVHVRGLLTVYESRGQYQMSVQLVQADGAGLLQARFEALKRKLDGEGLFDASRKRPLPRFPCSIGIVTSPTGAALQDMLNILARRAPWLRVVVSPVRVQGDGAAEEIAAAVEELNRFAECGLRPVDAIVVTRGGGSAEDLWEFNEEIVARALAASAIPVISAVGHEIDFTIADFVADLRAPTPSAAAELIAPDTAELARQLSQISAGLRRRLTSVVDHARQQVQALARSGVFRDPQRRLNENAQQLDLAAEALRRVLRTRLDRAGERTQALFALLRQNRPDQLLALRRGEVGAVAAQLQLSLKQQMASHLHRLGCASQLLRVVSPQGTLERGYALVFGADGTLVSSVAQLTAGETVTAKLRDGVATARVTGIEKQ